MQTPAAENQPLLTACFELHQSALTRAPAAGPLALTAHLNQKLLVLNPATPHMHQP